MDADHPKTSIEQALQALENGRLVALPTETVYGLAAPIDQQDLIEKIFALKARPFFDPLIIHGASLNQLKPLVTDWSPVCETLAKAFWPGPMTLVLPKNEVVSDLITAGLETVGIRIPNSETALRFLTDLGRPVAAPSANLFKQISPTKAADVKEVFDTEDVFVLDGGECPVGIESTILRIKDAEVQILRPGMISLSQIKELVRPLGLHVTIANEKKLVAPGQMEDHYQPAKPLFTVVSPSKESAEKTLRERMNFAERNTWLDLPVEPVLAARRLYGALRTAADEDADQICLHLPTEVLGDERWSGIIDRLKKASTTFMTEE